tara:strand:- start:1475 stop:2491 length:1017 start_codon:yes stop_codon:yes gene_type:complete
MIIGISGMNLITNFDNGYNQNVVFFCRFFTKYFSEEHTIISCDRDNWDKNITNIDLIIQLTPFSKKLSEQVKKKYPKCKNVFIEYGNKYYMSLEALLPTNYKSTHSSIVYNIDYVWICPDCEPTKYFYQSLFNASVSIAPFIWKPDNLTINPFIQKDYDKCHKKDIYIIEPNINVLKQSLIPILIVNELWKKNPHSFNKLYIISGNNYNENKFFQDHFLPKLEVLHGKNNKTYFCPRAPINDIFKLPGVLLSHQENLGLNYIYLEALYLKIQWVHNSPFFKDSGYYYEDKNIYQGVEMLESALKEWKAVDNSDIINKYSPDNEVVISKYKGLIADTMK